MKTLSLALCAIVLGLVGCRTTALPPPHETAFQRKLRTIHIPVISFEDADVADVVRHLKERSVELDPDGDHGVSIFLIPEPPTATDGTAAATTTGGLETIDTNAPDTDEERNTGSGTRITMHLKDVSLGDAWRYLAQHAQPPLILEISANDLQVYPASAIKTYWETRCYAVPRAVLAGDTIAPPSDILHAYPQSVPDGLTDAAQREKWTRIGVNFASPRARIHYNDGHQVLLATNTVYELNRIECFLGRYSAALPLWSVKRGETLTQISRDAGISIARLRELNDLHEDTLTPGQVLLLNDADDAPAP